MISKEPFSCSLIRHHGSLSASDNNSADPQPTPPMKPLHQMAASPTEQQLPDSAMFGSSSAIVGDSSAKSESSSEISRTKDCLSVEVDGCWAWMVTVTSFLIIMFVDGISFTYGVISDELIRYFHLEDNVAKGTIPGAVLQGFYLMAGK